MMVVVSYDVSTKSTEGQRRLKRVADLCISYGIRVQYSVFECLLDAGKWELLKHKLLSEYNPKEDSLKFYYLGSNWNRRVESYGVKKNFNFEDTFIL